MKISIAQMHIAWEDKKANWIKCEAFMQQAKSEGSDVIFFPEMTLTGFSMNTKVTADMEHETVDHLRQLLQKYSLAVGVGWVKRNDEVQKAENHYTVLDANGHILSDYVKIHPFSYGGENMYFTSGDSIKYFQINEFTCSNFICYDLRFPEIFQIASERADLIIVPANWPRARENHWRVLLQARAIENQAYIVGINCVGDINGTDYSGCSMVVSPSGEILCEEKDNEKLMTVAIENNVAKIRQQFPVKQDRKNDEMYNKM